EILLQRIDAKGVFHLERGKLSVGAVGLDQKFPVLAEEARAHAVIIEAAIVEVAQHQCIGRMIHRALVLGAAPQPCFRVMALRTGLAADKGSGGSVQRAPRRPAAMHEEECETDCEYDERRDRCPDPDCAPRQRAAVVDARSGILRWLGLCRSDRALPRPTFLR